MPRLVISAILGAVLSGAVIFSLQAQDAPGPTTADQPQNLFADLIPGAEKTAGGLTRPQAECVLANLGNVRINKALTILLVICQSFPQRP